MGSGIFLALLCGSFLLLGAIGVCLWAFLGSGSKMSKKQLDEINRQMQSKVQGVEESTASLRRLLNERDAEIELLKKAAKDFEQRTFDEIAKLRERAGALGHLTEVENELRAVKLSVETFEQKMTAEMTTLKSGSSGGGSTAKMEDEFLKIKTTLEALEKRAGSQDGGLIPEPKAPPKAAEAPPVTVPPTAPAVSAPAPAASATLGKIIYDEPKKPAPAPAPASPPPPAQEPPKPPVETPKPPEPPKPAEKPPVPPATEPPKPAAPSVPPKTEPAPKDGAKPKGSAVSEETVDDILALLQGKKPKAG